MHLKTAPRDTIMPDDLARTDSPLAEPVRRDSFPPERDRGAVQPVPTGHGTLYPSAGTEDDPGIRHRAKRGRVALRDSDRVDRARRVGATPGGSEEHGARRLQRIPGA